MEGFNINGKLLIGIDHGYGNMKTRHMVFKSGVSVSYMDGHKLHMKSTDLEAMKQITNNMCNPNANNTASEAKNELDTEHDKVKTKIDSNKDAANEIEDIYSHLKLMQQLESGGNRDIETPEEKKVGKKMDFSV